MQVVILAVFFMAAFDPSSYAGWGAVVAVVLFSGVKKWNELRKNKAEDLYGDPDTFKRTARQDERIHELLTQLRLQTDAARVVILRFHNGEQHLDGTPIQKTSVSYESIAGGIESVKDTYKEVEVSRMSAIIQAMFEEPILYNTEDDLPETFSRSQMQTLNTHTFACVGLHQNKDNPHFVKVIACLQIHWLNDPTTREDRPIKREWLKGEVAKTVERLEFLLAERLRITGIHS